MKPKTSRNERGNSASNGIDIATLASTPIHMVQDLAKQPGEPKVRFHDHHRLAKSQQRASKLNYYSILSAKLSRTHQNRLSERLPPKARR